MSSTGAPAALRAISQAGTPTSEATTHGFIFCSASSVSPRRARPSSTAARSASGRRPESVVSSVNIISSGWAAIAPAIFPWSSTSVVSITTVPAAA